MSSRRLQMAAAQFAEVAAASPLAALPGPADQALPAGISEQLAEFAFGRGQWQEAWGHYLAALKSGEAVVDLGKCLLFGARCALYLGEHRVAQALLSSYNDAFPGDAEGLFYLGKAYQGVHRDVEALNCFNAASLLGGGKPKYLAAVAQAAHSLSFQGFGFAADTMPATYLAIARSALAGALEREPDHLESLTELMLLSLDTGEFDQAMATCQQVIAKEARHGPEKTGAAVTALALALSRGGHIGRIEGIEYLATYPAGRRILARVRALKPAEPEATATPAPVPVLAPDLRSGRWGLEVLGGNRFAWPRQRASVATPAESISVEADYVVAVRTGSRGELGGLLTRLQSLPAHVAGVVGFTAAAAPGSRELRGVTNLLLRKTYWNELVARDANADWNALAAMALKRLRLQVVPQRGGIAEIDWPARPDADAPRPRVVVLSRHGPRLVGGGEQFLRIAGRTYAGEHDAEVLFAGLTRDWSEASTEWPTGGQRFQSGFVYDDPDSFRQFCLNNSVSAVHVISGLGEFVLDACGGLDVRVIYGVHFWREFIPARVLSRPYYPDVGLADALPLPTMQELLRRVDFAYVNSDFCAEIARRAYAWSPPVIYSVPIDEAPEHRPTELKPVMWPNDFVLLANARADKGWYLLLDVAEQLPDIGFVAIAGQSDRDAALADVHRRGLHNVRVLEHTDDMDEVYRAARIVLVPSFSFVETFSRVVIEAGRLKRPVLMADSGNLAYLGAGTDLVLPDDPAVWAARIAALAAGGKAYAAAVAATAAIAERHSAEGLLSRLRRIPVRRDAPRLLVCVGSGIGNICHTTPMIRRLSEHYGVPVDVFVGGDFAGSSAAMAGAPWVGQVFETYAHVELRPYDVVLVTHSFGTLVPAFNAYRVLSSRDFMQFDPAGEVHESAFNLAFLKQVLGIDYAEPDSRGYFFGGLAEVRPERRRGRPRIGLHAGSKGGIWAAKRWPGFAQLAGELIAGGAEVISVGIAEEYVEGTVDKTDLTIARMAEELSTCDAVVSNDSGIMNIANALGIPLVAIFGPTNPVTRAPLKSPVRVLAPATECSPCEAKAEFKSRFTEGGCRCISLIGTAEVLAALRDLGAMPVRRRRPVRQRA